MNMPAELPVSVVLLLSGFLTAYFGIRLYFFPSTVLPKDANKLNRYDAVVKGTVFFNIALLMIAGAWLFWTKQAAGQFVAWFIAILINLVGIMIYLKTWNRKALLLDLGRGILLLILLLLYKQKNHG
jgi:uncharacterized membrane protein